MANKQETDWIARIISAIIFAIAVYLIFRPICYLFKSWKIQKGNKTIIQNLHHNLGDFWLTEQEKQQFLFHTAQCDLADKKIKEFSSYPLLVRQDGQYDERNRDGKEANYYAEQKDKSEKIIKQLSRSPLKKWNQFNDSLKEEYSLRTANLLLWAYIPFLLVIRQSDDGAAIFILSMIFLGLLQLIVYKLTLSLVKNPAFPFTPKPGQVTLDNLNEHARGEKNAPAPFPVQPPAEHLELRGGYIFGSLALIISLPLVFMFSHQSPGSPQQISVLQKQTNLEEGIRNDFQKLEKMQKAIIRKKEYLLTSPSLQPASNTNISAF